MTELSCWSRLSNRRGWTEEAVLVIEGNEIKIKDITFKSIKELCRQSRNNIPVGVQKLSKLYQKEEHSVGSRLSQTRLSQTRLSQTWLSQTWLSQNPNFRPGFLRPWTLQPFFSDPIFLGMKHFILLPAFQFLSHCNTFIF